MFSEDECTVVSDSMVIYTDGVEDYDAMLLPLIKEAMDSGVFNTAHPAIVRATYLDELAVANQVAASQTDGDGFQYGYLLYAIPGLVLIVLVIAGLVWRKRRGRKSVDALSVDTSIQAESAEKSQTSSTPALQEASPSQDSPDETRLPPPPIHPGQSSSGQHRPTCPVHHYSIGSTISNGTFSEDITPQARVPPLPPPSPPLSHDHFEEPRFYSSELVPGDIALREPPSTGSHPGRSSPGPTRPDQSSSGQALPVYSPSLDHFHARIAAQSEEWTILSVGDRGREQVRSYDI